MNEYDIEQAILAFSEAFIDIPEGADYFLIYMKEHLGDSLSEHSNAVLIEAATLLGKKHSKVYLGSTYTLEPFIQERK